MAQRFQVGQSVAVCGFLLFLPAWLEADAVVGNGTPASCTEAALNSAVATVVPAGGTISFNCGGPATIGVTAEKVFLHSPNPNLTYTVDGGGVITLNGQGVTRIIHQVTGTLNLQNITFTGGRSRGVADEASGGAIRSDPPTGLIARLNLSNVTFVNNTTELTGWSPPFSPFDYGGAAVFTRWGIVNVNGCYFANNTANNTAGGAMHGRASTVSISNSVFASNVSNGGGFGGAIYFDSLSPTPTGTNGSLQVVNSSFTGNTAWGMGGAIFWYLYPAKNESVSINAINVVGNAVVDSGRISFVGNRGFGGGLVGDAGSVLIQNSTFANNTVRGEVATNGGGAGGGIWLTNSNTAVIRNVTVSGNRAIGNNQDAAGGGVIIYNNTQPFQIVHSTIVNNQAGWVGGGIHSSTNGVLTNTVVANNSATAFPTVMQQCSEQLSNGGGALQYPNIQGSPGPGNPYCANSIAVANPLLGALASNGGFSQTHHPQAGSPLVNAVGCAASTDQRGVTRPQGPACDIGSVEVACSLTLTPLTLPTGRVGTAYSQAFSASGGTSPISFSLTGTLPTGLTFNAGSGMLSGTPSQAGAFGILVTANDSAACSASRTYNLAIATANAITPAALAVDAAGNGVLEPNETAVMDPSWSNQTGGPVGLTGSLFSLIGPAGATYAINDSSASYGTVPSGGTARCSTATGNCYSLAIAAASRPESHWDASVVEAPSTGGAKAWTLHLGGSFADVPSSSSFYRYVETLLHRGITGGCAANSYCPGNSITRDQVAVFALVAKEGSAYVPPACSPPNTFNDVPETSGFCRWIEELARRGVVSGCGGGNYCPSAAVSREQMAVIVLRTLDPALNPPACSPPNMFNDVPETSGFCRWIEELAGRGVVSGCGGGNYCPANPVARDQMGVFLSVTFGLTLYGP